MNEVHAVKEWSKVQTITEKFREHYTDTIADLWLIGINVALRISDLLPIKYDDVISTPDGYQLALKEKKTGKKRIINLNVAAIKTINKRRKQYPGDIYIFQAKGVNQKQIKPLSRQYVTKAFNDVAHMAGVDMKLGTHSMRKTWGYHTYKRNNDIGLVQKTLQHSRSSETLAYIGILDEDVKKAYEETVFDF